MDKFFFATILICLICFNLHSQYVCPRHMVDCSYGCRQFTDTNADGFCDWGLLSKDFKTQDTVAQNNISQDTIEKKIEIEETKDENKTKQQKYRQNKQSLVYDKLKTRQDTQIIDSQNIENQKIFHLKDTIENQTIVPQKTDKQKIVEKPYSLISISLATFLLYFFTLFLAQKQKIKKVTHRRIWNVMLLLTFLVSGLFGLLLVIQINYNFAMDIFRTILYWHVQFGIAMSLIAIFHFLWHLKYYLNLFRKNSDNKLC